MFSRHNVAIDNAFNQRAVRRTNLVRPGRKPASEHHDDVCVDARQRRRQHNFANLVGPILPGDVEQIDRIKLVVHERRQRTCAHILAEQARIEHFIVRGTIRNLRHFPASRFRLS